SKAQPREMLPVVDKPVIQYIVEEAVASGIEEIVFVTSNGKRTLEDHFDRNFELEYRLEQNNKIKELKQISAIGKLAKFAFVRQQKPLGDGHAILAAVPFIERHEAVAVLFGDDIFDSKKPGLKQLIEAYEKYETPIIGLVEVPKSEVHKYGVVGGTMLTESEIAIEKFVEKPLAKEAPSNLITPGKYIITPEILELLKTQKPGKGGEIRLADAFITYLEQNKVIHGKVMKGTRYDCGNKLGLLIASIEFGLKHPEIKKDLKKYLRSLSK
ncbi:UTP--glucose-1-phosphate uridylyltransferase, partial [Candidatus Uhrbacteria bacterium CG_4_9_14_3_um_filter_41_35]